MPRPVSIAGLQWHHHGPSFYELQGFPQIEVAYLGIPGEPTGADWFLFLNHADGSIQVSPHASRDAACAMVARAFSY